MPETEVVIVDAVRTPIGKRKGGLASVHSVDLLGVALTALVGRTGVDPAVVDQVVGGCVSQVGMQSFNVTRTAWLAAGLPAPVAASTVDAQCGSSQQAGTVVYGLLQSGVIDVGIACGVENMSQVPIGSNSDKRLGLGRAIPTSYFPHYEFTSQFEAAERIADTWSVTRADADEFGLRSEELAAAAWSEDRFAAQLVPVDAPDLDEEGKPTGTAHRVERDEGLRATTLEGLATPKPVAREDGVHTAGTASQISDGSSAVLLTKAVHGLQRADLETALVTMCCGGGLGTGTVLQRL